MTGLHTCLHIVPETGAAGAENQALYTVRALRDDARFRPEIAFFRAGRSHARFEELDVGLHEIAARRRLILDAPRRVGELVDLCRAIRPALIHCWLLEANVLGLLTARRTKTPVVVTQRSGPMQETAAHRLALRRLLPRAAYGIANSSEGGEVLVDLGLPRDRLAIVGNAVPADRLEIMASKPEVRKRFGLGESGPLAVTVGRPDRYKDYPTLLSAMQIVWATRPDVEFLLVGPTREQLVELTGIVAPPGCYPVGWQEDVGSMLNAADVVVLSSWTEGHSNVVDEALMLGRPVVTTDTGAHPALVREAGGRVAPVRNPRKLAQGILELLESPPSPDSIRRVAAGYLSIDAVLRLTLGVYDSVLRAQAGKASETGEGLDASIKV